MALVESCHKIPLLLYSIELHPQGDWKTVGKFRWRPMPFELFHHDFWNSSDYLVLNVAKIFHPPYIWVMHHPFRLAELFVNSFLDVSYQPNPLQCTGSRLIRLPVKTWPHGHFLHPLLHPFLHKSPNTYISKIEKRKNKYVLIFIYYLKNLRHSFLNIKRHFQINCGTLKNTVEHVSNHIWSFSKLYNSFIFIRPTKFVYLSRKINQVIRCFAVLQLESFHFLLVCLT